MRHARECEFVACAGLDNRPFNSGEPVFDVFDVADRLLEIADEGFAAQQAVVHAGISDVNGDRVA